VFRLSLQKRKKGLQYKKLEDPYRYSSDKRREKYLVVNQPDDKLARPVLRIRNPVPFLPLDLGSEMGKNKARIRDEHLGLDFRDLTNNFWVKNTLMQIRIRDPGFATLS
jgi:hypothetical protein